MTIINEVESSVLDRVIDFLKDNEDLDIFESVNINEINNHINLSFRLSNTLELDRVVLDVYVKTTEDNELGYSYSAYHDNNYIPLNSKNLYFSMLETVTKHFDNLNEERIGDLDFLVNKDLS